MPGSLSRNYVLAAFALLASALPASAHLSYAGRNFGTFSGLELQSNTITGQTAVTNWGWADATDADFGHSHRIRFFRFTLENTATVTISVSSLEGNALLPAFSIYSGLAHIGAFLDYENDITFEYLSTLPGPTKEGGFNALATWKLANDESTSLADFSTFTYMGNAADGTPVNYGAATGINGDGVADGFVTGSFVLPAGNYTIAIGGANYAAQGSGLPTSEGANAGADLTPRAMNVSVAVVPEPTTSLMAMGGLLFLGVQRRRVGSGKHG